MDGQRRQLEIDAVIFSSVIEDYDRAAVDGQRRRGGGIGHFEDTDDSSDEDDDL